MAYVCIPERLNPAVVDVFRVFDIHSVYLLDEGVVVETRHHHRDYRFGLLLNDPDDETFASHLDDLKSSLQDKLASKVSIVLLQSGPPAVRSQILRAELVYSIDVQYATEFEDLVFADYLDFRPEEVNDLKFVD